MAKVYREECWNSTVVDIISNEPRCRTQPCRLFMFCWVLSCFAFLAAVVVGGTHHSRSVSGHCTVAILTPTHKCVCHQQSQQWATQSFILSQLESKKLYKQYNNSTNRVYCHNRACTAMASCVVEMYDWQSEQLIYMMSQVAMAAIIDDITTAKLFTFWNFIISEWV